MTYGHISGSFTTFWCHNFIIFLFYTSQSLWCEKLSQKHCNICKNTSKYGSPKVSNIRLFKKMNSIY